MRGEESFFEEAHVAEKQVASDHGFCSVQYSEREDAWLLRVFDDGDLTFKEWFPDARMAYERVIHINDQNV